MLSNKANKRNHNLTMLVENDSSAERSPKLDLYAHRSKKKYRILNITSQKNHSHRSASLEPHNMKQPPTVNSMLKGILKKAFKNNHLEDLKLNSLNFSQK